MLFIKSLLFYNLFHSTPLTLINSMLFHESNISRYQNITQISVQQFLLSSKQQTDSVDLDSLTIKTQLQSVSLIISYKMLQSYQYFQSTHIAMKQIPIIEKHFEPEAFYKFQENYFRYENMKYRTSIVKKTIQSSTYYITYAAKKEFILSDDCQLVAICDQNGNYYLGHAQISDGFPHIPNKHPILVTKIPLEKIKDISDKSDNLTVSVIDEEKPLKFKFEIKKMAQQWKNLIYDLKAHNLMKNRQSLAETAQSKIENVFGLGDKNNANQDWKQKYLELEKKYTKLEQTMKEKSKQFEAKKKQLEMALKKYEDSYRYVHQETALMTIMEKQIEELKINEEQLNRLIKQKDEQIQKLKNQLNMIIKQRDSKFEEEKMELTNSKKQLESDKKRFEDFEHQISQKNNRINYLEELVNQLETSEKQSNLRVVQKVEQILSLEKQLNEERDKVKRLNQSSDTEQNRLIEEKNNRISFLENELEAEKTKMEKINIVITEKVDKMTAMKKQFEKQKNIQKELYMRIKERDNKISFLEELNQKNQHKDQEFNQKIEEKDQKIQSLEKEIEKLKQKSSEQIQQNQLKEKIGQLQKELEKSKQTEEELRNKIADKNEIIEKIQRQLHEKEIHETEINSQLTQKTEQLALAQKWPQQKRKKLKENGYFKAKQQQKIKQMSQDIESLKKDLQALNGELSEKDEVISELKNELDEEKNKLEQEKKKPRQIVNRLKKTLQESYEANSLLKVEYNRLKKKNDKEMPQGKENKNIVESAVVK